jgi:hypothetical protein
MSSWLPWGDPKGKRMLEGEELKKAFPAIYIDPNGAEIYTPRGQAEFIAYADAKKNPKTAGYMREWERCSADNKASVAALGGQKIAHRDFAQEASDRDRAARCDDKGKGTDKAYDPRGSPDGRRSTGGREGSRRGGGQASSQHASNYYSSRR